MKNIRIVICLSMLLTGMAAGQAAAQDQVTGKVTDSESENNEGLPGVAVMVKGTTRGTATDFDGNYTVTASPDDTLVFSFVGYVSEERIVGNKTTINVSMLPDIEMLSDVVVVGYGSLKEEDVTGSISTVSGEDLSKMRMPSFDQNLQGTAAGIQVSSVGGVPGGPIRIQVRGTNSIASETSPLFIIDGVPIASEAGNNVDFNPMTFLNPDDIESISILKDAAATAVYGSRGANGVVLITTKSGDGGGGSTSLSVTSGISQAFNLPEFANSRDWWDFLDDAIDESGTVTPVPDDQIVLGGNAIYGGGSDRSVFLTRADAEQINTDWFDQTLRTGVFYEANLSHSGGTKKSNYFLSANYRKEESIYEGSDFQRVSFRLNATTELHANLKGGIRFSGAGLFVDQPNLGDGFRAAATSNLTWLPLLDSAGNFNDPKGGYNPGYLLDLTHQRDRRETFTSFAVAHLEYSIPWVEGLSVRSEIGADLRTTISNDFTSGFLRISEITTAVQTHNQRLAYNLNAYASYEKTFGQHYLNVVAGTERFQRDRRLGVVRAQGVDQRRDIFEPGNVNQVTFFPNNLAGTLDDVHFVGLFGRATYKWRDRYIVNGSFRRDASSKWPSGNRYATFSAISGGWIISEEAFWPQSRVFEMLKLRASYGETGNDKVPSNLGEDNYADWPIYGNNPGIILRGVGNSDITWEQIGTSEVGLEFGLFNNRVSGGMAYYQMVTRELLFPVPVPSNTGGTPYGGEASQWANFAQMTNAGFEFEVLSVNVDRDLGRYHFKWETSFNITFNRTNTDKLFLGESEFDYLGYQIAQPNLVLREGDPVGLYSVPVYAGINDQGEELIFVVDDEGNLTDETTLLTATSGQANRYVDEDITTQPTYWGGITNTLTYGPFDMSFFFMFQGGNYLLDLYTRDVSYINGGSNVILASVAANRWESQFSPDDALPRATFQDLNLITDRFLSRGDFVKLRFLRIGYNLPKRMMESAGLKSAQLYVMGNNLLTLTGFEGLDPEVVRSTGGGSAEAAAEYNLGQGIITPGSIFPQVRTYTVGLNLGF